MLYDRIKAICDTRGMSIAELEKKSQLSNGTIRKWSTNSPRVTNLKAVANILDVSLDSLTNDKGNRSR